MNEPQQEKFRMVQKPPPRKLNRHQRRAVRAQVRKQAKRQRKEKP